MISSSHSVPAVALLTLTALAALVVPPAAPAQGVDAAAGESPELVDLFPFRAPIRVDAGGASNGLARLVLPPEVLEASRPDLSDLRILDAADREVAYLVDAGRADDGAIRVLERRTPEILGARRGTAAGGPEEAPPLLRESYTLPAPPAAPAGQGWELVLDTPRDLFVRSVAVAPPGDTESPLAEGSVFRLAPAAGSGGDRERLRLALPPDLPDRLTVVLEGEGDTFLEPAFWYERSRRIPGEDRARVPLAVLGVRTEGGRTTVELERPGGLVPDLLVLRTSTPAFNRPVEVWDEGPGAADRPLGAGTLYRVPAPSWMDTPIEDRSLALAPPRGDRLRVVIENGDSPPLAEPAFEAAVRQPSLVFSLGQGGAAARGTTGTLLFGGGRVFRPRYDLQALLPELSGEARKPQDAEAVLRIVDPGLLAEARLGPVEPNPRHDPAPALAFAHRPGAPVEPRLYRHRRTLDVVPSDDGLARLALAPADLARARPDLADLRIAGAAGTDGARRQWAYLVDRDAAPRWTALPVERRAGNDAGTSEYAFELPARPATVDRLTIDPDAPFFDRPFTLRGTRADRGRSGGRETILASGRLERRLGDPRPATLAFPATRVERLVLEIDDGSDAPLELRRVEGRFPMPMLYFPVPAGSYDLLLGHREAEAPSYELTRARDLVFAVAAAPAETGPLEDNPAYSAAAGLFSGDGPQRLLLWAALLAAVLVLAVLTLRLARREE